MCGLLTGAGWPRIRVDDLTAFAADLLAARDLWAGSEWVRDTFGADVQAHYTNMARVELAAFTSAVTDWERYRSGEWSYPEWDVITVVGSG